MPIGPITPGSYVTVTPDSVLVQYSSVQAPTATMPVIGSDIQELTLVVLNVQNFCLQESANGLARKLDKIDGGTVLGNVEFDGDVDFEGTGIHRPVFAGGMHVTGGELTLDALTTISSSGTNVFGSGSDTSFDGTAVLHTTSGGKFRWDTRNRTDGNYTADGTNGYEDILPDPAGDRTITLANTGAARGQRKKFNAQNVTGPHTWALTYGAQTWYLSNLAGYASGTVKIEFVYDGSGWVVDDWEHGSNSLRDG